ncbi:uncharacterized protein LOC135350377 isoform X2 [Halichondria panicea]
MSDRSTIGIERSTNKSESDLEKLIPHLIKDNEQILSLLKTVPQRSLHPSLERFQMYRNALQVYRVARGSEKLPVELKQNLDANRRLKQRIYQIVFEVLHHQEVLIEILVESRFFASNLELRNHEDLVSIMAYDFQSEKFSLRLPTHGIHTLPPEVIQVAESLWAHKVKLGATLSRMRVKQNAKSITQLIPDHSVQRKFEYAEASLCAARVNLLKVKIKDVISRLLRDSVNLVHTKDELLLGMSFYQAKTDLLVFSSDFRPHLYSHQLVAESFLLLQDLSSYYYVDQAIQTSIGGDVIFTECHSGTEVLHAASILGDKGTVKVFSVPCEIVDGLTSKLRNLGLHNVQLISTPFSESCSSDVTLSNVKLVMCALPIAQCSTLVHPVDHVLQEGEHNLSWLSPTCSRSTNLTNTLGDTLTHALQFEQAERIVLLSSIDDDVNPIMRDVFEKNRTFSLYQTGHTVINEEERTVYTSSYTITVLTKKHLEPRRSNAVLSRAVAKGLLDTSCLGDEFITPQKRVPSKKKPKERKTKRSKINALHQGIPLTPSSSEMGVVKK